MGMGSFDPGRHSKGVASGSLGSFAHSRATMSAPVNQRKVHDLLDPRGVNNNGAHTGQNIREALDSDEHPDSVPIVVLLDVTGSMLEVPGQVQSKMGDLFGMLQRKGYVEHPQILFGAIGDATKWDQFPCQYGQFESDNRLAETLEGIILEGGGGGGGNESYELAAYFVARHTFIDSFEKRGKKGYLFIIGDEQPYGRVEPEQVKQHIAITPAEASGPVDEITEPISTEDIFKEVFERWEVYVIRPTMSEPGYQPGTAKGDEIVARWKALVGSESVLPLDDTNAVCEVIALTIGLGEGVIDDVDEGIEHLKEIGAGDESTRASASKALATVGSGKGVVTTGEAPDTSGDDGVDRT